MAPFIKIITSSLSFLSKRAFIPMTLLGGSFLFFIYSTFKSHMVLQSNYERVIQYIEINEKLDGFAVKLNKKYSSDIERLKGKHDYSNIENWSGSDVPISVRSLLKESD